MPYLRFREEDGKPYVRGRNSTWYPDDFAMDKFHAMGLEEGGDFSWELFDELLGEEHLRTGLNGVPSHTRDELETYRNLNLEIQAYFDDIKENASPDFEDLKDIFQECLRQVLCVDDSEVRKSLFFSVAEGVMGLIKLGDDHEEKRGFAIKCKNRLIRRTPHQFCIGIRKYFGLDEEEWNQIRSTPGGEGSIVGMGLISDNIISSISEVTSKSGGLDRLEDLLRYAYEQNLVHGNNVEIEVRVTNQNGSL